MLYNGARLARHHNTRKLVEETLGLDHRKRDPQTYYFEGERPQMTVVAMVAFQQKYEEIKRLVSEARSMRINKIVDRAKIRKEDEGFRWTQMFA